MSEAILADLAGAVRCRRRDPALLGLIGTDRASGLPVEIWFAGALAPASLPAELQDACLRAASAQRPAAGELQVWELVSAGQSHRILARSAQVHTLAAGPFYAALDLPKATLLQRCKWALLFNLLRLPFVSALLLASRR